MGVVEDLNRTLWEHRARGEDPFAWEDLGVAPPGVEDDAVDDVSGMWHRPVNPLPGAVVLAIHGGGFVSGSIATHRRMFAQVARAANVATFSVEYGLVPDAVFPAQIATVMAAYRWLRDQGIERIALVGDSCGATLAASVTVSLREAGEQLPEALYLISAWTDLEATGGSYDSGSDPFFTRSLVRELATGYLAGTPATDPVAAPIHAGLHGFPPVFLQAGGEEALLDDSRRFAERLHTTGVEAVLEIEPGQLHTFQMSAGRTPTASDAVARAGRWLRERLGS